LLPPNEMALWPVSACWVKAGEKSSLTTLCGLSPERFLTPILCGLRDLLTAVAATGFEALRERLLTATAKIDNPEAALIQSGIAYVCFGVENPSLFRLMFGSTLSTIKQDSKSALALAAAGAKGVLEQIIRRGVLAGVFVPPLKGPKGQQVLVLAAWSIVHGLTTLAIDGTVGGTGPVISDYAEKVARAFCHGIVRR